MVRLETVRNEAEVEEQQRMQQERMERLRNLNNKFRNPASLQELESIPAFKRRGMQLNEVPHSSESMVSRLSVGEGSDGTDIRQNNSFLHNNVD